MSARRKLMVALIVALLFTPYWAGAQGWQIGQRTFSAGAPPTANWTSLQSTISFGCLAGSTCELALSSASTANSVIVAVIYIPDSETITSLALTGCTGSAGTWTGGSGSNYAAFNSATAGMATAYNLGNGGGCTGIDVTVSGTPTGGWGFGADEFSRGGGTPVFDALSSTNTNTTSCTSCTGSAFSSLSGTKDLLVQVTNTGSGTGSPSSPYVWDANQFVAYALNSTVTAAPTWTQTSGGFQSLGFGFK
jgi:hypothetical protein